MRKKYSGKDYFFAVVVTLGCSLFILYPGRLEPIETRVKNNKHGFGFKEPKMPKPKVEDDVEKDPKKPKDLKHLKGITTTYRMTNKLPVRHSPYVSGILHPLKVFLEGERVHYLSEDDKTKLRRGSTDKITAIYYDMVSEVVNVARKTESSLQRLRQGAQRRVGASTDASDNIISDTDKICMQLFLDIQEYARNLRALGIDAREIESYIALWQCVAPKDKQDNIQF